MVARISGRVGNNELRREFAVLQKCLATRVSHQTLHSGCASASLACASTAGLADKAGSRLTDLSKMDCCNKDIISPEWILLARPRSSPGAVRLLNVRLLSLLESCPRGYVPHKTAKRPIVRSAVLQKCLANHSTTPVNGGKTTQLHVDHAANTKIFFELLVEELQILEEHEPIQQPFFHLLTVSTSLRISSFTPTTFNPPV